MPRYLYRLFLHPMVDGSVSVAGVSREGEFVLRDQLVEVLLRLFDCHMHYLLPFLAGQLSQKESRKSSERIEN